MEVEPNRRQGGLWEAARWGSWIVAILGGMYTVIVLSDGIDAAGYGGDTKEPIVATVAVCLFLGSLLAIRWLSGGSDETIKVLVFFLAIFGAFAIYNAFQTKKDQDGLVTDYCAYGATSPAQYQECMQETKPGVVEYLKTPAAEYARGKPGCGEGAGPYCSFSRREAQDALDAADSAQP